MKETQLDVTTIRFALQGKLNVGALDTFVRFDAIIARAKLSAHNFGATRKPSRMRGRRTFRFVRGEKGAVAPKASRASVRGVALETMHVKDIIQNVGSVYRAPCRAATIPAGPCSPAVSGGYTPWTE